MTKSKSVPKLNTVNNAISLLSLFLKYNSVGLVDIEKEIGISKTAAFRLAVTMSDRGLLHKDEETKLYYPGPLLFQLIRKYQVNDIVSLTQPYIRDLANKTSESIYLSIRTGNKYIYLTGIDSTYPVKVTSPFSEEIDLYIGAAGKLHMAFMSPADIQHYFKKTTFHSYTERSLTVKQLKEQLSIIRNDKYATSLGERMSDAGGIAAPIWDFGNEPIATLGIYLPMTRLNSEKQKEFTDLIINCANNISAEVKASNPLPD